MEMVVLIVSLLLVVTTALLYRLATRLQERK
jgi:hypothetical protein